MKKFISTIIVLVYVVINAGGQCSGWIKSGGGIKSDQSWGIALDDSGNIYTSGVADSIATFGSYSYQHPNTTSNYKFFIYLSKYTADGLHVWTRFFEGYYFYSSPSLDIRGDHIFMFGSGSYLIIGSDTLDNYNLFFAKFDLNGNPIIAKGFLGSSTTYGFGIAAHPDSGVIIGGRFGPTLDFGGYVLNGLGFPAQNAFLARLNDDGSVIWAKAAFGGYYCRVWSIAIDHNKDIVVSGYYSDSIKFDNIVHHNQFTNQYGHLAYIAKFDDDGNCQWVNGSISATTSWSHFYGLNTDVNNNIYFTGTTDGEEFYDDISIEGSADGEFIIGKADPNGNFVWVKSMGSPFSIGLQFGTSVHFDATGNIIFVGQMGDSSIVDGQIVTTNGAWDICALKTDANGHIQDFKVMGSEGTERSYNAVGNNSDIYVNLHFRGKSFNYAGDSILNNDTVLLSNTYDVAILKICRDDTTCNVPINPQTIINSQTSVTLQWNEELNATGYVVRGKEVNSASFISLSIDDAFTTSIQINNLNPLATYTWQVKAVCDSFGTESNYTEFDTFHLFNCLAPVDAFTSAVSPTSAVLNWTPVPEAIGYEIVGNALGLPEVSIIVPGGGVSSYTVNNLSGFNIYQWAVRSICTADGAVKSEFSNSSNFVILGYNEKHGHSSLLASNSKRVHLFPNPATSQLHIRFEDGSLTESGSIHLYDLAGRLIQNRVVGPDLDLLTMDLRNIHPGIYQIELSSGDSYHIEKLVIHR